MNTAITEESIDAFAQNLRENEKSRATIEKYTTSVRKLQSWLNGEEITKDRIIAYRDYLQGRGLAVSTVNGALSAVNAYLGLYGLNECRVKFLRAQRSAFRPAERELSREEFQSLVQTARTQENERLALAMETICGSGIRVSELKYVTVEAAIEGRTQVTLKGKIRTILLPSELCRKLLGYAKKQEVSSGEIFRNKNGDPLSRKQIWFEMKELCEAAGVESTKVFPHNLRHLFARCFYGSSNDIVKLADVLGHSSIETTRIYLVSTGEEHAKTIDSLRLIL